jgi:hypothetical protein
MRAFRKVALVVTLTVGPAIATAPPAFACGAGQYKNSSGQCVSSPKKAPAPPKGSTAQCRDGTYSFSKHRSGTCSGHGGVARWLV